MTGPELIDEDGVYRLTERCPVHGERYIWDGVWKTCNACYAAGKYDTHCADCGAKGELTGHMTCQYPQDRP